jgi:exopolyphosphatase/guanosine-5'-triphosphate,3'-diphosphate pyrophosphatase
MIIAEVNAERAVLKQEYSEITRLGEGMQPNSRYLREVPMRRTLKILEAYAQREQTANVEGVVAVGTAALRDAENSAEFLRRVKEQTGLEVEVISGEEEARLSYLAVRRDPLWRALPSLVVVDVGGGSTEIILGEGDSISARQSINWGAVKITESFLRSDPPSIAQLMQANEVAQAAFEEVLLDFNITPSLVVGVGGTITTLAAMQAKRADDYEALHGITLDTDDIEDQITQLSQRSLAQRKEMQGLDPKRADIIVGGAILLAQALEKLESTTLTVSTRGLRWGVLYDRF